MSGEGVGGPAPPPAAGVKRNADAAGVDGNEEDSKRLPRRWPKVVLRPVGDVPLVMPSGVCSEIISAWRQQRLSAAELQEQAELVTRLDRIGKKWVHKGEVCVFGSRATGIGCAAGDDVDLSLSWPGYDPAKAGTPELAAAFDKKLAKLLKTMHAKGFQHPKPRKNSQLDVLITCTDVKTGLHVDLTLNNVHGRTNTRVLAMVHRALPELAPAMWALKRLGKARKILNATGGFFSSYCLLHMMVAVAQDAGLLPAIPQVPSPPGATDAYWAQLAASLGLPGAEPMDAAAVHATPSETLRPDIVGRLLSAFAAKYHVPHPVVVAITASDDARTRGAEHIARAGEPPQQHDDTASSHDGSSAAPAAGAGGVAPVYVADVVNDSNCARTITPKHWLVAVNEFGRMIDLIRNGDGFGVWTEPRTT